MSGRGESGSRPDCSAGQTLPCRITCWRVFQNGARKVPRSMNETRRDATRGKSLRKCTHSAERVGWERQQCAGGDDEEEEEEEMPGTSASPAQAASAERVGGGSGSGISERNSVCQAADWPTRGGARVAASVNSSCCGEVLRRIDVDNNDRRPRPRERPGEAQKCGRDTLGGRWRHTSRDILGVSGEKTSALRETTRAERNKRDFWTFKNERGAGDAGEDGARTG